MRFVRQATTISVTNFDDKLMSDEKVRKHGNMLPTTIRGIVCGPSNCGKTNVFISLIESPLGVRFENLYVYSKSLQQPKYEYLQNLLTPIDEIGYFTSNAAARPNAATRPNAAARPNVVARSNATVCGARPNCNAYPDVHDILDVSDVPDVVRPNAATCALMPAVHPADPIPTVIANRGNYNYILKLKLETYDWFQNVLFEKNFTVNI